jgi:hypothetical protein
VYILTSYGLDESGSVPIIVQVKVPLPYPSFLGCHSMPRIQCRPVVLSAGKCLKEVQFNGMSVSSAGAENEWKYTSIVQYSATIFTLS